MGGFNEDDTHVALRVLLAGLNKQIIKTPGTNQQVAASIAKALGINPNELEAVQKEPVCVLPLSPLEIETTSRTLTEAFESPQGGVRTTRVLFSFSGGTRFFDKMRPATC
jgi:hypothetical protein